jgi:uncharacterized protein (TIGR00297 family)
LLLDISGRDDSGRAAPTAITRANLNDHESESNFGKPIRRPFSDAAFSIRGIGKCDTAVTAGFWESIFVSLVAAVATYWRKFLTLPGAIAAAILGSIILFFGGWGWGATTAGSFFITALLSQLQDCDESNDSSSTSARRNLNQVLANGLLLTVLAIVYRASDANIGSVAAFLGCVGAVAGDTWATSASQFSTKGPRLLTTGQRVPAGTPGAVTGIGIALTALAGLVASVLYLSAVAILGGETAPSAVRVTLGVAAIIGAVAGSIFDSYLGAACQAIYTDADGRVTDYPAASNGRFNTYVRGWRWLSNDLVNFSNSVAGASSAYCVWIAAVWLELV